MAMDDDQNRNIDYPSQKQSETQPDVVLGEACDNDHEGEGAH